MGNSIRKRIYEILIFPSREDAFARLTNAALVLMIAISVIAVILETVDSVYDNYIYTFSLIETIVVAAFSFEYILRLWACSEADEFKQPVIGRIKYGLQPLLIIDLLAILPFYLPMVTSVDLIVLRMLRLIRILRVFKLARYNKALKTMFNVLCETKEELSITLLLGFIFLIIASTFMYAVEHEAQPEVFSSIPSSLWWGVATLTTVGYGDIYPVTSFGRAMASVISILGIGMFALPAGILGSGFVNAIKNESIDETLCSKCGEHINKTER